MSISLEALGSPGPFLFIDQQLAIHLVKLVADSKHIELDRQINQEMLVGRQRQPPCILRGRQIARLIVKFFETERGK